MSTSVPHYCIMCDSHHCRHATEINERNYRLEASRMEAGRLDLICGSVTSNSLVMNQLICQQPQNPIKNKKLLLLRRKQ